MAEDIPTKIDKIVRRLLDLRANKFLSEYLTFSNSNIIL